MAPSDLRIKSEHLSRSILCFTSLDHFLAFSSQLPCTDSAPWLDLIAIFYKEQPFSGARVTKRSGFSNPFLLLERIPEPPKPELTVPIRSPTTLCNPSPPPKAFILALYPSGFRHTVVPSVLLTAVSQCLAQHGTPK